MTMAKKKTGPEWRSRATEWHETHPIPPEEFDGKPAVGVEIKGYGVAEWCPSPDGSGKPEAVILHFDVGMGDDKPPISFMFRFKSRSEVNRCVALLLRHADGVWPESKA
jgi:hypothetical protein